MKRKLILLITTLVLSCNQNTKTHQTENSGTESKTEMAGNLGWLTGNWKRLNEETGKETFENWEKISSNEYSGIGFTIQKGHRIACNPACVLRFPT